MNAYTIADLNIAYTPQSDYVEALLSGYRTAFPTALTVTLSESMLCAERADLPDAPHGVVEAAALLRTLSRSLPALDRLLLHAAVVEVHGAAYAFVAPAGTGKTTHARLWEEHRNGARILNGDKTFLHVQNDVVIAHGSPWRGKEHLGYNGCAPLRGLFVLTRSEYSYCEPLSAADALPYLLRATPFPSSKQERLTVLSLLERLTAAVPLYHLQATPSVDAVDAAAQAIGGTL